MRTWILLVFAVSCAVSASGCSSISNVQQSQIEAKIGSEPEIGRQSLAPVGATVYSQYRYWTKTGYRMLEGRNIPFMLGRVAVSAGEFVVRADSGGVPTYCTERAAYADPLTGPLKSACFLDPQNEGIFRAVKAAPGLVWFGLKLA